jgi:hypothetical protein
MPPTCYAQDSERKCEYGTSKRVMAFTGKYDSNNESGDEDMSDGEIAKTFKLLWVEDYNLAEKQKNDFRLEKDKLMSIITGLQEKNTLLNSKLENMTKYVRMLNNGSNVLAEILQVGKTFGNMKGIGFDYDTVNKEIKILIKKFVPFEKKTEFVMLDHMPQLPFQHLPNQETKRNHLGDVTIVVDTVT